MQRPAVSDAIGVDVWLKCESLLPTAAFKVRGGLNLVGRDPTARVGVMGASTGNHGQSLAYAGKVFGVPVTIFHPRGANPLKLAAMRASGATLVEHGVDFDEARVECARRAAAEGLRYVHSGTNRSSSQASRRPRSRSSRRCRARTSSSFRSAAAAGWPPRVWSLRPSTRRSPVIGVQSDGAPAAYQSWRDRAPRETERINTFAEGLATRTAFDLPQRMMRELLDDFVLVSDEDIYAAMRVLLVEGHVVSEGAGAAAIAAARKLRARLQGRTVVCWISGGNATAESLTRALSSK